MLVFVRPSFLPLLCISVFQSTLYSLFFPLIQCIMLSSRRKTRGYARYSPALFPLLFCLIGRCSRRWSLGVQEQEILDVDHRNMKIPDAFYDIEFPFDQE